MISIRRFVLFFFLAAYLAASAPAQTTSSRQPVSEAQLVRLIPALRAFAAQAKQPENGSGGSPSLKEAVAARLALIRDITEGKIDPLEWLTANSDYAIYPLGADYSESVSRLASELMMRPCAVFGFGLEASELGLAKASGDREAEQKLISRGFDRSPDQEKINTVMEELRRFYTGHKIIIFTPESPLSWSAQSPDSSITYTIMEANTYRAWENEDLPTGPILELSWNEAPEEAVFGPLAISDSLPEALEKAKLNEREFLDLVTAMTIAREDARNPARLKISAAAQPQSEADKKILEEIREILGIRQENLRLYKRYFKTLDPLLDAFEDSGK